MLKEDKLRKVLQYMASKPYAEVFKLVGELSELPTIEVEDKELENKPKEENEDGQ
jgi:hypothetical protein